MRAIKAFLLDANHAATRRKVLALVLVANAVLVGCVVTWKLLKDDPEILINQAGYLPGQEKIFFVQTRYSYPSGSFDVVNTSNGTDIISGRALVTAGSLWNSYYYRGNFSDIMLPGTYRIVARFDGTGAALGEINSFTFAISTHVYDLAMERGYQFFYYQRCGTRVNELVPGYVGHEPCHLDDHIMYNGSYYNLTGGYHSAGDYAKHIYWGMHCEAVPFSCLFAYESNPGLFNKIDDYDVSGHLTPDGVPDVLDEAMWGLDYLEKAFLPNGTMIGSLVPTSMPFVVPQNDTDNIVGTPDDRQLFSAENHTIANPYEAMWAAAGFATMANVVNETGFFSNRKAEMFSYASNIYNNYSSRFNFTSPSSPPINSDATAFLLATLEMYRYTNSSTLANQLWVVAKYIHDNFPDPATLWRDELGEWNRVPGIYCYWAMINGTAGAKAMASDVALQFYDRKFAPLSSDPDDIFGLMKFRYQDNSTTYFWSNIGLNSYYETAAFSAFMAYHITGGTHPELLAFGLRQLDWLFGQNLFNTCMVEGVGSQNPTIYHQRYAYIPGNPRGATPGAIINGVVDKDGAPFINTNSAAGSTLQDHLTDSASNEPWLPHNVHFMLAMGALQLCI